MATLIRRTWHGDEIVARSRRANGRAIIGMGEQVAGAQARAAHVLSGALRRSVHVAPTETMGELDAREYAQVQRDRYAVEVGSWLPYACVENNRGGEHRFADLGWDAARPRFRPTLRQAWAEEGLR